MNITTCKKVIDRYDTSTYKEVLFDSERVLKVTSIELANEASIRVIIRWLSLVTSRSLLGNLISVLQ
jgi:hypothetical protein